MFTYNVIKNNSWTNHRAGVWGRQPPAGSQGAEPLDKRGVGAEPHKQKTITQNPKNARAEQSPAQLNNIIPHEVLGQIPYALRDLHNWRISDPIFPLAEAMPADFAARWKFKD